MEAQQSHDDGLNRAVMLMMTLDKPVLARVLKHLSGKELGRIMQAYETMAKASAPTSTQLMEVGSKFLASETGGSSSTFKDALTMAFGEDGAEQILRQDQWRTIPDRVKPEKFAAVLSGELPEAVAIALAQLPPRFAAEVLTQLPEEKRVAVVENLARAETAPKSGVEAIMRAVEQSVNVAPAGEDVDRKSAAKRAAAVLNQLDSEDAAAIIEHLRAGDGEGAALIEAEMFQFGDFLKLENRAMQAVLAEMRPERLARALKGVTDEERGAIFAALTEQVRTIVEAEIADAGPISARDVKAARREIIDLATKLDREGRIKIHAEKDLIA
ncbi:MAG TPA: FliG C-terminal domain-containing protein [Candidatus Binataceae bacterium]|nr:FliG C-terminal domain-containing protein [Candidatus Binataceae bacterium]